MVAIRLFALQALATFAKYVSLVPYVGDMWDIFTLLVLSILRFGSGNWVAENIEECNRPKKTLILYEFEGCPYCRRVREALSQLDLDCIIYPCPRETFRSRGYMNQSRFRPQAKQIGGKLQFPLLIDENNTNSSTNDGPLILYESDIIVEYLWKTYGAKASPTMGYSLGKKYEWLTFSLVGLARCLPQHGILRMPSAKPDKMLELWSFEGSPFCRRVREVLASLEIPYYLRNVGHNSLKRKEFRDRFGKMINKLRKTLNLIQVPLLVDPNTNLELLESSEIVKYLLDTYKTGEVKEESYLEYGVDDKKNN